MAGGKSKYQNNRFDDDYEYTPVGQPSSSRQEEKKDSANQSRSHKNSPAAGKKTKPSKKQEVYFIKKQSTDQDRPADHDEYRPKKPSKPAVLAQEPLQPAQDPLLQPHAAAQNGTQDHPQEKPRHSLPPAREQPTSAAPVREQPAKKLSKYEADDEDEDLDETYEALVRRQDLHLQASSLPPQTDLARPIERPVTHELNSRPYAHVSAEPAPPVQADKRELTAPPGMEPPKPAPQPRDEQRLPINLAPQPAPPQATSPQPLVTPQPLPAALHTGHPQAFPGQPLLYPGQPQAFYYPAPFLPQMTGGGSQMMYPMMFGMPQPSPDGTPAAFAQQPLMLVPQPVQAAPGQAPAPAPQLPFMMPPGAMLYPGAMLPQVPAAHQDPQAPPQQPVYFLMPVMLPPTVPLGVQQPPAPAAK